MVIPWEDSLNMKNYFWIILSMILPQTALALPHEIGPLPFGKSQTVKPSTDIQGLRVQSFGNTVISFSLKGQKGNLPQVTIEGPLANFGDGDVPGTGPVASQPNLRLSKSQGTLNLKFKLTDPGVYRILIHGTTESTAPFNIRNACLENCNVKEISNQEFIQSLKDSGRINVVLALFKKLIARYISDPLISGRINDEFSKIIMTGDLKGLRSFPTLPVTEIGSLTQGAVTVLPNLNSKIFKNPSGNDPVLNGNLIDVVNATGKLERSSPSLVNSNLPGVGNGEYSNLALTAQQVIQSGGLAQVLTSLSLKNGSQVVYNGKTITTPGQLLTELASTGHHLRVADQRTYANFISFNDGDKMVRWPSFINTGITLPSGETVVVPMSHSQFAWEITGPEINARVTFFLGITGTGFFPNTHLRPTWTGLSELDVTESKNPESLSFISRAAEAAAVFLRRVRVEREKFPAGLPIDGYGVLEGVCDDATADIRFLLFGKTTPNDPFPQLRSHSLDGTALLGDGLDKLLAHSKRDTQVPTTPAEILDTLSRIRSMNIRGLAPWSPDLEKIYLAISNQVQTSQSALAACGSELEGLPQSTTLPKN
jgi:hypothetical protein